MSITPAPFLFFLSAWLLLGYLLGSIPVAWLLARWITGTDLRQAGSGNVGVMNTAISVSRWAALVVFLSEITKGLLAAALPRLLISGSVSSLAVDPFTSFATIGVVAGTRWPVWLRFKGGRGNTTGMAALLFISWQAVVVLAILWFLSRLLLKSSFRATRATMLLIPVLVGGFTRSVWFFFASLALLLMFLEAQRRDSDDHMLLNQRWSSLWNFLTSPPRNRK